MKRIFLIPQKAVSLLKQRARNLKRNRQITHHEALEIVAKTVGFDSWHQVAGAAEKCRPIEDAFRRGFLLAFDSSEVPDLENDELPIEWEEYAFELLRSQLFENYCAQLDEEDLALRPISKTLDSDDLKEYFELDWGHLYFFRLRSPEDVSSSVQLLELIAEHSLWMPRLVFFEGELIDMSVLPATDKDRECLENSHLY
ncbi:hypothetical protein [Pseudomonas parafulva]|uniref:hypothetical protein n=1 Tax=Pseudomonas parafulva TaxID=157782 RepID=UPI000491FD15|nr:hypothetical protein [Pseudomonas parafulva]